MDETTKHWVLCGWLLHRKILDNKKYISVEELGYMAEQAYAMTMGWTQ